MQKAVESGRQAYLAGRMEKKRHLLQLLHPQKGLIK